MKRFILLAAGLLAVGSGTDLTARSIADPLGKA